MTYATSFGLRQLTDKYICFGALAFLTHSVPAAMVVIHPPTKPLPVCPSCSCFDSVANSTFIISPVLQSPRTMVTQCTLALFLCPFLGPRSLTHLTDVSLFLSHSTPQGQFGHGRCSISRPPSLQLPDLTSISFLSFSLTRPLSLPLLLLLLLLLLTPPFIRSFALNFGCTPNPTLLLSFALSQSFNLIPL
jgi:hypothetical protein